MTGQVEKSHKDSQTDKVMSVIQQCKFTNVSLHSYESCPTMLAAKPLGGLVNGAFFVSRIMKKLPA